MKKLLIAAALSLALFTPAKAQMQIGIPVQPMGYCQIAAAALSSAVGWSSCISASFTGTCSGTTLTASAVTGDISVGWPLSGTGILAGTYVLSQGTGTGGAGTYTTSQACTSVSNSLTTIGPPNNATFVLLQADTQTIHWRDDGGAPTTAIGIGLLQTQGAFVYSGTVRNLQFIDVTAGGILNASFYKSP